MANFSAALFSKIGLLLVLICWTKGSTGAAFSFEEEFLQLKENYNRMNDIMKNLESKVIELRTELESKDAKMEEKVTQLDAKNAQLEAKVQEQDSLLFDLLREKNERTGGADSDFATINQSAVAINGLPSSCGDLKMIGHIWNGIYSVMGSAMMESVYCDFSKLPSDTGFQKLIGYVDVKSASVHFYVQRTSIFNTTGIPIPFNLNQMNEGNAMNLTSGIFTAPQPGIYFFSFTALAEFPVSSSGWLGVQLYLNGGRIGEGYVSEGNTKSVDTQLSPLSLQLTMNLKPGDKVWLQIVNMEKRTVLYDDGSHHTHFTGFLLEEEIAASIDR